MNYTILVKNALAVVNFPRFLPHLLLYFLGIRGKHLINSDMKAAARHHKLVGTRLMILLYLLTFDKYFRNVFYFRLGKWRYTIQFLAPQHNTFVIDSNAIIGEGMLALHPIATTLNAERIGSGFTCRNNTVVGIGKGKRPIIGNNVSIGTNCVVIGGITIGDNVTIGAGTVLTKSVPSNCVVIGNPAFILKENGVRVNKKI